MAPYLDGTLFLARLAPVTVGRRPFRSLTRVSKYTLGARLARRGRRDSRQALERGKTRRFSRQKRVYCRACPLSHTQRRRSVTARRRRNPRARDAVKTPPNRPGGSGLRRCPRSSLIAAHRPNRLVWQVGAGCTGLTAVIRARDLGASAIVIDQYFDCTDMLPGHPTFLLRGSTGIALGMNEGSKAPDYFSGPIWAIFDRAAVERDGWNIDPPFTPPTNGFFFSADTIEELAAKIFAGHEFQRVRLAHLAKTVARWNSYVDNGSDPEFARGTDAPMYRIDTPPFYAATLYPVWHDSYGGLRINGRAQVVDVQGEPIPGLYAGGEASGGGNQHGLGRALVHGYIAGTNAAQET